MTDTSAVRTQTRILKAKATEIAIAILADEKHELYKETFLTVLKNTVPRTQEIAGDPDNNTPIPLSLLSSANVQHNDSNPEDTSDDQENPGSTGGDISE